MSLLVSVSKVVKSYNENEVLNGVDLKIYSGERIALLGSNGSGKSTFIKTLLGFEKPDSGEVKFEINPKKDLGYMPQKDVLIEDIKVFEILNLVGAMYNQYRSELDKNIEFLSLSNKKKHYISDLSGGERRKLSFLISIINTPNLLILDEPTTGLDLESIDEFWNILSREKGSTLVVTHDFNQIDRYFNRVLYLDKGIITADKKIDELRKNNISIEKWYRTQKGAMTK
ncbi:ABC transporter ATP-binding protein [Leuconostoc citreum]|uniref:ABC transporter ATP-binding protein n=1 Tax=Leuconostoc citreum TaxID=33964 RepID=UPI0032DE9B30